MFLQVAAQKVVRESSRRRVKFQGSVEDLEGRLLLSMAHHGHPMSHHAAHVRTAEVNTGTASPTTSSPTTTSTHHATVAHHPQRTNVPSRPRHHAEGVEQRDDHRRARDQRSAHDQRRAVGERRDLEHAEHFEHIGQHHADATRRPTPTTTTTVTSPVSLSGSKNDGNTTTTFTTNWNTSPTPTSPTATPTPTTSSTHTTTGSNTTTPQSPAPTSQTSGGSASASTSTTGSTSTTSAAVRPRTPRPAAHPRPRLAVRRVPPPSSGTSGSKTSTTTTPTPTPCPTPTPTPSPCPTPTPLRQPVRRTRAPRPRRRRQAAPHRASRPRAAPARRRVPRRRASPAQARRPRRLRAPDRPPRASRAREVPLRREHRPVPRSRPDRTGRIVRPRRPRAHPRRATGAPRTRAHPLPRTCRADESGRAAFNGASRRDGDLSVPVSSSSPCCLARHPCRTSRELLLVSIGRGQKVIEGEEAAKDQARPSIEEAQAQEVGVHESDRGAHRQPQGDLLEPPFESLARPNGLGDRLIEELLIERGLPDGIAIVLLDPGGDRRVGVVIQLVLQSEDPSLQLDMLVCLVVARTTTGRVGHPLVTPQAMLEEPEIPAFGIPAVADPTAEKVIAGVEVISLGLVLGDSPLDLHRPARARRPRRHRRSGPTRCETASSPVPSSSSWDRSH